MKFMFCVFFLLNIVPNNNNNQRRMCYSSERERKLVTKNEFSRMYCIASYLLFFVLFYGNYNIVG